MNATHELPKLIPFPSGANGPHANLMFVNAQAKFGDLWEESDLRIGYARQLAEALATVRYGADGPHDQALPAFACVVSHLLSEAQVFEKLAYEAAKRESGCGDASRPEEVEAVIAETPVDIIRRVMRESAASATPRAKKKRSAASSKKVRP